MNKNNSKKYGMKKKPLKHGFKKVDNSIHTTVIPTQPSVLPVPKPLQSMKAIKVSKSSNKNTIVNNINMPTQPSVPPMPKPNRTNSDGKSHSSNKYRKWTNNELSKKI